MELSQVERVMLANQYKILSLLDPSGAEEYDKVREALENGYESVYSEALSRGAYDEQLSPDESRLVIHAMDLYWAMQRSYDRLEDEDKAEIREEELDFPGFDGNNETKFVTYSQFVVEKEGRFTDLRFEKDQGSGTISPALLDRYNSHVPMVEIYRKRAEYWYPMGKDRYYLSKDTILSILDML